MRVLIVLCACALAACSVSDSVQGVRETALQRAIKAQDVDQVRALLDAGAPLGRTVEENDSAWELALRQLSPSDPRTTVIARLVLTHTRRASSTGNAFVARDPVNGLITVRRTGRTSNAQTSPVELAAHQWSPDGIALLIEHGLDLTSESVGGALVHAAANGCLPCLERLLDAGASPDRADRHGDTALAMARRVGNDTVAGMLVSRGAHEPAPRSRMIRAMEAVLGRLFGSGT